MSAWTYVRAGLYGMACCTALRPCPAAYKWCGESDPERLAALWAAETQVGLTALRAAETQVGLCLLSQGAWFRRRYFLGCFFFAIAFIDFDRCILSTWGHKL